MGKRLHSAIKYEVKYKYEHASFNYAQEYINPIIITLAEDDGSYNDECPEWSDTIEGNREVMLKNLDKILHPDSDWEYQEQLDEQLDNAEKYEQLTRQYIHDCLKEIIEESDKNCHYTHFAWF